MALATELPSLTLLDAWLLPYDYAIDLCDTIASRRRAAAARAAGGGGPAAGDPAPRRTMADGRRHSAGVSKMMAMFGA